MIITSRLKETNLRDQINLLSSAITLESFDLEDGVHFIRKRTDQMIDQLDGQDLVTEVAGLPLALDQAAAYLRSSKCKLSDYLKKLKKDKLKILNKEKARPPTENVERQDWRSKLIGV